MSDQAGWEARAVDRVAADSRVNAMPTCVGAVKVWSSVTTGLVVDAKLVEGHPRVWLIEPGLPERREVPDDDRAFHRGESLLDTENRSRIACASIDGPASMSDTSISVAEVMSGVATTAVVPDHIAQLPRALPGDLSFECIKPLSCRFVGLRHRGKPGASGSFAAIWAPPERCTYKVRLTHPASSCSTRSATYSPAVPTDRKTTRLRLDTGVRFSAIAAFLAVPAVSYAIELDTADIASGAPIDAAAMVDRFEAIETAITTLESGPVGFHLEGTQNVPEGEATVVLYETIDFDESEGNIVAAAGVFTVAQAGIYRVDASVRFNAEAYAADLTCDLRVFIDDGAREFLDRFRPGVALANTHVLYLHGSALLEIADGDDITVRASCDAGAGTRTLTDSPNANFVSIERVH